MIIKKKKNFAGDKKKGKSILAPLDQLVIDKLSHKIPKCVETYHLTMLTVVWSGLIILTSYMASVFSFHWLWITSICIALQYLTDVLDGAVGRLRNTGLIKWGYYMDHFLDYIFLCSILIGYSFIVPAEYDIILFFILVITGAFIVNAYLGFAVTNELKVSFMKFGPTEARLAFIIVNTLFILFQKTYLSFALPFVLGFTGMGLIIIVYKTQKYIWSLDMEVKKKEEEEEEEEEEE